MKTCLRLASVFVLAHLTLHAQETTGWQTILATSEDLKPFPPEQVSLEEGLLHVRAGNGILLPQPTPDGVIRARLHFRERTGFPQLRIRRTGNAEAKNTDYYEVIAFIKPGQTSVKEFYVNLTTRGKGKRLGIVPLPEPFVLGGHMDVELSVVGQHLQVVVNGQVAFELDDNDLPRGGYWGLAALDGWYSNVQVRSLPRVKPVPKAPKSMGARLIELENAYEAAIQRDATAPHIEAVQALDVQYLAALDRALDSATQASNLEGALALRNEKKRLENKGPLPMDDGTANEALKSLRQTYRTSLGQLESLQQQRLRALQETFLQALNASQEELTRAKDLDAALEMRKRREFEAANPPATSKSF